MTKAATLFFGKLPSHGDFVRFNAAGPEIKAFDLWLQEAIYKAGRAFGADWPAVYRLSPAYRFVFFAPQSEAGLAGVLRPSHDQSGRHYPFIVAGLVGQREFDGEASLFPLVFADFFAESEQLAEDAASELPLSDIISRTTGLASSLAPRLEAGQQDFQDYIRSTTWGQFCERLFGRFETPSKYLLVHNLIESLRPSSSRPASPPSVGLRFPLTPGLSCRGEEVSFWNGLGLCLLKGYPAFPNMFWDVSPESAKAYHFFAPGRPPVRLFFSLVQPSRENDGVCRLDEDEAENAPSELPHLSAQVRTALESREATLLELLNAFSMFSLDVGQGPA